MSQTHNRKARTGIAATTPVDEERAYLDALQKMIAWSTGFFNSPAWRTYKDDEDHQIKRQCRFKIAELDEAVTQVVAGHGPDNLMSKDFRAAMDRYMAGLMDLVEGVN